jgi:hypothetical protein
MLPEDESSRAAHRLSDLRMLRPSDLRRLEVKAGVYWDTNDVLEKDDLIRAFVQSGRLDILPEDESSRVAYCLSDLSKLRPSDVRRLMIEAGVHWDSKDVLEKDDLIRTFVQSGRLDVLPDNETTGARIIKTTSPPWKTIIVVVLNSSTQYVWKRSTATTAILNQMTDPRCDQSPTVLECIPSG